MGIRCFEKQGTPTHSQAALPNVETFILAVLIVPVLLAGAGIYGPNIIRLGKVQSAAHQQRSRFQARASVNVGLKSPRESQETYVGLIDLAQTAEALS
jgi:hypothetical protein